MRLQKMRNRMMPLVEQIYFVLLEGGSNRTIHISLKNEIISFLKEYKMTKGLISIKNSKHCIQLFNER